MEASEADLKVGRVGEQTEFSLKMVKVDLRISDVITRHEFKRIFFSSISQFLSQLLEEQTSHMHALVEDIKVTRDLSKVATSSPYHP